LPQEVFVISTYQSHAPRRRHVVLLMLSPVLRIPKSGEKLLVLGDPRTVRSQCPFSLLDHCLKVRDPVRIVTELAERGGE
jgi:hypothetical protein